MDQVQDSSIDPTLNRSATHEAVDLHSTLETYIQQAESHEQTSLGHSPSDPKKAIQVRTKKVQTLIMEAGKKLAASGTL